jgi:glycosyltransferase involved in cell wall biosynthesis
MKPVKLVVVSHKPCWPSTQSPTGYATDGGFPFQMRALAELFDETVIVAPVAGPANRPGERPLTGQRLSVVPLTLPRGADGQRKLRLPFWLLQNGPRLLAEIVNADAVHTPIPGDLGTLGMLLAWALGKPLFVRHCGNWAVQRTAAERFWRWFMERTAGGRNVMLATGAADEPPSTRNPALRWIFSTSLTAREMQAWQTPRAFPADRAPRLITVCRQEHGKGVEVVLQSLPLLQRQFPGLTHDIVGTGSALAEYQATAQASGLSQCVTFHGQLDQASVLRMLQRADLFCFPTRSEGFPKVVLEALACGLPVITTRVSALPKLIGNGSGLLLNEASPVALAAAVRECLADAGRYARMAAQARATAQQYTLENWQSVIGARLAAAWGPLRQTALLHSSP